ncbi:MAG: glycosyltransferase family 4 protein, partial [Cyclobacteriaceae bacterium]|nr:glycosyltransferase family 4 protein [Cyclobacteriaceae bacterium]
MVCSPISIELKKKTILEICLSNGNGGLELYFHRCGTQLRSRGYNVITVRSEGTFLSNLIENKQVNDLFLAPTAPWKRWLYFRAVCKIIKTYKIDIVHAHHKDDLPLVALVKTFSRKKVKVYFTRQMPLPHRKFDWYHRWLYGKLDGMIAITEKLKQDILEKIPISPGRVHRLYYGVAAPPILDEQWTKDFLSISQPGDFNLGVFSRFEFQKGQHTVIESLKMLRDRGIPAKLYLAGNVAEKEYVEFIKKKITEYALDEVVSFK